MRKKHKKTRNFNPLSKTLPRKSHKKRNALLLGGALAVILAGASVKNQDQP